MATRLQDKLREQCGVLFKPRNSRPRRFCSSRCFGDWTRSQNPVKRDWLYQKYVVEGLSCPDIAVLVQRNPKQVWEWLRGWGIPTRPRGSDERVHFKKGQPNAFQGRHHTQEVREAIRQARLRDGHVPYLKNGVHYLKGKHGADTPNWKGGITPERQAFYATPEWKRACVAVWHRADARCERCGLDHRTIDRAKTHFTVHHIISFANRELRAEPTNLVLLCRTCHLFVHSSENVGREFLLRGEDTCQ